MENAFANIQQPYMIKKTLSKVGMEGAFLNIIKAIYDRHIANIIFNWQNLRAFPLRSGTISMPAFTTPIQHSIGSPGHTNDKKKKERKKSYPNWKGGSKTVVVADDVIVYIESYRLHQKTT